MSSEKFHIGETRSRKRIYALDMSDQDSVEEQTADYSNEDHFDSFALFTHLVVGAFRAYGESSIEFKEIEKRVNFHVEKLGEEYIVEEMERLSLLNTVHLSNYGKCRLRRVFHE